ncbi:hypothetical protein [Pseudomonas phage LKD16]|uniref:dATP/dGTP diphosphohydrolase N-terminal domain-containing protein n=1 Tax=Pseudomonas phage LKD16 TaxID=386792 RepID=Q0E639_9CAUD|nr:DUF5664 domain-containing protein [Pseudomonas phage LKD16]CAK25960.1 hypothetical protein [Pseudomonas phage LKD16]
MSQVFVGSYSEITPDQYATPEASLEGRKVGKLPMNLVVEGFPRLKRELARMMKWAAESKGYLPHDWKKMTVAQFKEAQHRHESKRLLDGPLDDESNLMHLVHEAFNAMAAAEVALTKEAGPR